MSASIAGIFLMFVAVYIATFVFSTSKLADFFNKKYGVKGYEIALISSVFGWIFLTGLVLYLIG
jgi:uncharacterized membrane protein